MGLPMYCQDREQPEEFRSIYLEYQKKKSVHENLIQLFFEESGRLFEEPVNLMKQELKEPMSYHSIISAITSGASKMNEIL